jgi:hypothetical protein
MYEQFQKIAIPVGVPDGAGTPFTTPPLMVPFVIETWLIRTFTGKEQYWKMNANYPPARAG